MGGCEGCRRGEGQREEKGERSGEDRTASVDAQDGGLDVGERKEKFLSNIVVGLSSSETLDRKALVEVRKTMTEVRSEFYAA